MNNETSHGRILIVDDDEMSLKLLSAVLTTEGYTVFKARDGVEALDKFEKVEPDLIVLDLAMPRLNGHETCAHFRRNPKVNKVPILIVTGAGQLENRTEAYQVGANDFLTKPVGHLELVMHVRALLNRDYKPDCY